MRNQELGGVFGEIVVTDGPLEILTHLRGCIVSLIILPV